MKISSVPFSAALADNTLQDQIKDMKRVREANKQHREKNEKDGREAAPGIGVQSEFLALKMLGGAITPNEALRQIEAQLKVNGRTDKQAKAGAEDIFADATKDAKEGVIKRMFETPENEKQKTPQVFDANSLVANFQASVGGDESKKQTGLLTDLRKMVDEIARRPGFQFRTD